MLRFATALVSAAVIVVVAALTLNFYANRQGGIGAASPSPSAAAVTPGPTAGPSLPPTSGGMWPQSTLEEVRAAQERADAGDPDFTWQLDPALVFDAGAFEGDPFFEPGVEIAERFLREELGWDAFLFNAYDGFGDGSTLDGVFQGLAYLRCAPGEMNPLYPIAGDNLFSRGGGQCAPTIDELHYETVSFDLAQPGRRGPDGIWVVADWTTTSPFLQADPRVIQSEAEAQLEEFLQARVDGEGAEGQVTFYGPGLQTPEQLPLLYATTTGAPYERFEIERVGEPQWPSGGVAYEARLFADDGATVIVEQYEARDGGSPFYNVRLTTENGLYLPQPFAFWDDKVTVSAPHPWDIGFLVDHGHAALDRDENHDERIEFVDDPLTVGSGCQSGQSPANAADLADAIRSDPDLAVTDPVAVTIAGQPGLSMDITAASGASICEDSGSLQVLTKPEDGPDFHGVPLPDGIRMRLYLLDAPDDSSIDVLAIAITAPESRFDEVLAEASPIIETVELK